jgi:hypothetical protein
MSYSEDARTAIEFYASSGRYVMTLERRKSRLKMRTSSYSKCRFPSLCANKRAGRESVSDPIPGPFDLDSDD